MNSIESLREAVQRPVYLLWLLREHKLDSLEAIVEHFTSDETSPQERMRIESGVDGYLRSMSLAQLVDAELVSLTEDGAIQINPQCQG